MTVSFLPKTLTLAHLANTRAILEGELKGHCFPRLAQIGVKVSRVMVEKLEFARGKKQRITITGQFSADVTLICQRCLGNLSQRLSVAVNLAHINDADEADELESPFEPLLCASEQLESEDLLEDELLLNVPLVAKHESDSCETNIKVDYEINAQERESINPFSKLKELC